MNPLIEYTRWVFKWLAIIVSGVLALGALLVGVAYGWQWWTHDRHVAKLNVVVTHRGAPASKVVAADSDKAVEELCSDEYPIFVGFTNNSTRTVEWVQIDVSARLPDHSTNILRYDSNIKMDRIVPPGEGFGNCARFQIEDAYKSNPKTAGALYGGEIYSAATQLVYSD